jgi:WD40 repeat protein
LNGTDPEKSLHIFEGHDDAILAAALDPDNRRLVTASSDNTVRIWDLAVEAPSQAPLILRIPSDPDITPAEAGDTPCVLAAAVSPNSQRLATVSSDNTVRLWNLTADAPAAPPLIDLGSADEEINEILPAYPWSIAVPVRQHFIQTTDRDAPTPPQQTGVDELEIGSTFIITGK